MRALACVVWVGVMCAGALAQNPKAAEAPLPPPATAHGIEPAVELPVQQAGSCPGYYAEFELLLRWFKPVCASVPIVTIGNPADAVPGAQGQPGTQIVVGGSPPHKFEFPMTPGFQVNLGWDRGDGAFGVEVSGFLMEQAANSQRFDADANGAPNSYLPYQDPQNAYQALPFTVPGVTTGNSLAVGSTRIWGIEADGLVPFTIARGDFNYYGKFLIGARYLDLTDRVRVRNTLRLVADPTQFATGAEQFSTHNQFAGPQVGTTLGVARGRWSVEYTLKLAGGFTHQTRNIEGNPLESYTLLSPLLVPGPLQALPSNIGSEKANRVTLVPEIALKSKVDLTSWCTLSLGYSLLYWNKVLCPGDQMNPYVNITQLPFRGPFTGTPDPKPQFDHTDYFAQGLNFGMEFRY